MLLHRYVTEVWGEEEAREGTAGQMQQVTQLATWAYLQTCGGHEFSHSASISGARPQFLHLLQ